jgi:hypothetical protein
MVGAPESDGDAHKMRQSESVQGSFFDDIGTRFV